MTALYIIGGIILLIVVLFNIPVRAELSYINSEFDAKVKYLWFTLYPVKERPTEPEKIKKAKKEPAPEKTEDSEIAEYSGEEIIQEQKVKETPHLKKKSKKPKKKHSLDKDGFPEKLEIIKMIINSSKKGLKRLVKGIRIDDIALDFFVANEDAYEAAMNYGRVNMAVYNTIAFLRTFFTVSIDHVNISVRFNSSDSAYDGSLKLKLTPHTALLTTASIFLKFLVNNYKDKKEKEKINKTNSQKGMVYNERTSY